MKKFQKSGDFERHIDGGTIARTNEKYFTISTSKSDSRNGDEKRAEYRWVGTREDLWRLLDELNEIYWNEPEVEEKKIVFVRG